jgi:hypothetical protein
MNQSGPITFSAKSGNELETEVQSIRAYWEADRHLLECMVLGLGGGTRGLYREVGSLKGVSVLWIRSMLPHWLFFLRPFVASVAGLASVNEPSNLKESFELISQCCSVCVLIVSKEKAPSIATRLQSNPTWKEIELLHQEGMHRALLCAVLDSSNESGIVTYHDSQKVS